VGSELNWSLVPVGGGMVDLKEHVQDVWWGLSPTRLLWPRSR